MFCLNKSDVLHFPNGVIPSCTTAIAYFASIGFIKYFLHRIAYFKPSFYIHNSYSLGLCNSRPVAQAGMHMAIGQASIRTYARIRFETRAQNETRAQIAYAIRTRELCERIVRANLARVSKDAVATFTWAKHRNTT